MGTNAQNQEREDPAETARWERDKGKTPSRQAKEDKKETKEWEAGKKRGSPQQG